MSRELVSDHDPNFNLQFCNAKVSDHIQGLWYTGIHGMHVRVVYNCVAFVGCSGVMESSLGKD